LQRAPIAHQSFDRIGLDRSRKSFGRALASDNQRNRKKLFDELAVHFEHPERLALRPFGGRVRRVSFLPKELCGAQEHAGAHSHRTTLHH